MSGLTKYSPALASLRHGIDRLFDDVLRTSSDDEAPATLMWTPRVDISETEDRYVLKMDLPGLSKEGVAVKLQGNTLTVSGERREEREKDVGSVHRMERTYGRFYRAFTLPQASDPQKIEARMEDGVLTVEVPKREDLKPRKIEVS